MPDPTPLSDEEIAEQRGSNRPEDLYAALAVRIRERDEARERVRVLEEAVRLLYSW